MNIKHIFCKHIDKEERREDIREEHEDGMLGEWKHIYIASHRICLKCERKKMVELVRDEFKSYFSL